MFSGWVVYKTAQSVIASASIDKLLFQTTRSSTSSCQTLQTSSRSSSWCSCWFQCRLHLRSPWEWGSVQYSWYRHHTCYSMSDSVSDRSRCCTVPLYHISALEHEPVRVQSASPLGDLDRARLELIFVVIHGFPQCIGLTLCDFLRPGPVRCLCSDFCGDGQFDLLVGVWVGNGACGYPLDDVSDAWTCLDRHGCVC